MCTEDTHRQLAVTNHTPGQCLIMKNISQGAFILRNVNYTVLMYYHAKYCIYQDYTTTFFRSFRFDEKWIVTFILPLSDLWGLEGLFIYFSYSKEQKTLPKICWMTSIEVTVTSWMNIYITTLPPTDHSWPWPLFSATEIAPVNNSYTAEQPKHSWSCNRLKCNGSLCHSFFVHRDKLWR